ncbi:MAG: TetR/AcrR family transcriptional regulator [Bermanella sp.]
MQSHYRIDDGSIKMYDWAFNDPVDGLAPMTSANKTETKKRLSQQERSKLSQSKLIAATIESLIQVGYSQTSIQEICRRAELSKGGLFRQYPTRTALMIATAGSIYEGLLEQYIHRFNRLKGSLDDIELALTLIRKNFSSPEFQAAMELHVAARTDKELSLGLKPIQEKNNQKILELSKIIFPKQAESHKRFSTLINIIVLMFQGEAFERGISSNKKEEKARFELLEILVRTEFDQ